ncbi:hypothetical protein S420910_208 [Synechococcus phage S-CAM7]|uniref:Uncharacterized protein n=2 Tax=Synechococcus phage S-CAM7 TaxID=1883368 RepID=A0A1D8KUS4_9CAUD|nr:hypothetical protein S420910_208 [Synechococcus phage S-CAM7]
MIIALNNMAFRIWHSPVKSTVVETWEEVFVYYQVQLATVGHQPDYWEEISEEEYIKKR